MLEIYAVELKNEIDKHLFEQVLNYIPENKKTRIKRFLKFEDSVRSLIAEVIIRKIIIAKLKIKNSDILFEAGEYGKPYLKDFPDFHYNISHSGQWVLCAISNMPVGIDVEIVKEMDLRIAERFFSEAETKDLLMKKENERLEYFFDLWTLKESYIKADGRGLHIPLNSFSFKIENEKITFNTQNELKQCFFKRYKIDNHYKLSVCSLASKFPDKISIIKGERLLSEFLQIFQSALS
ncbi:UNVERIFIED_CONTAM: 4'-phosphopantetheinyl transferase [Acetivibrio alkalicellulosi]